MSVFVSYNNFVSKKILSSEEENNFLNLLEKRFDVNMNRHVGIVWDDVRPRIVNYSSKLWSLWEMERTGGEPDIVGYDKELDKYIFFDCSLESPSGRRSLCYDREGWVSRKAFRPKSTAMEMAESMGIEILDETEYRVLQALGEFDLKTSSWLKTPDEVRRLGGAFFGDRRYNHVFVFHNGADAYYAVRGFRGKLRV